MPHTPALQRFIDDELNRAAPIAERIHAGALRLLRDVPPPGMARLEIDLNFEAAEAMQRRAAAFRDRFVEALRERAAGGAALPAGAPGAGDELALLDESQVQVDIEISRAMQQIDTTGEWELRELSTFTSTLAGLDHVSAASNPLGASAYAGALWDASGAVGTPVPLRAAVMRVASGVLAGLLRTAWAAACSRLESQGIVPGVYRTVVLAPGSVPGRASFDATQPGVLHGLLAQLPTPSSAPQPAVPGGFDPRVVELLARVFESIQSDPELDPAARAPIARLQAAALRVALQDRTLLDAHDHPVWRLMDRIAADADAADACKAAVDEVTGVDAPATADFRRALAVLDARLAAAVDAERRAAQPAIAALERRERREFLTQQFASRLGEQAAPVRMGDELRRFATQTWAGVLAEAWLRFGEGSVEAQELVRTVDDLLWSLNLPDHPQSRQRLLALLPSLLQRLRRGMALVGLPQAEEKAVLDELMAVHTAALKPRGRGVPEAALTPQQIVQQMRDEVIPEAAPGRPFVDSVIDIASMDTVPMDFLPTRPGEPDDGAARRLDAIKPGDRLRLFVGGRWSRVRLLWRGDRAQHFLFAAEALGATHPFTRRALDRLADAGLVQPLETQPLVQRAVDLLLRRITRAVLAFALGLACGLGLAAERPRIGLVLSGGGARGLAHVGVLKVLERERVPIDAIAGTSMGAIIGGLYAGGMSAAEIETALLAVNWDAVFAPRVDRQQLSQRRKEEDFEISPVLEIGMRNGELRAPLGALSGRGLETLLRRYTLAVRQVHEFDRLPIPFRAVATDMETGQPVILARGDLATALRSSMSVPGVFAPTEVDGRILGDGGLVDNVPIDVVRAMGVDIAIVVNIGTPLAPRETLGSVGGLTAQMINILTEQNVQRSLASLAGADVLVAPELGKLTSGDFARTAELIALGEKGAQPLAPRFAALALEAPAWAAWRERQRAPAPAHGPLAFVGFEGTTITNPQRFAAQLESLPGQPFDEARAERDARRLAASGDYTRADFRLVSTAQGEGLVFDLEDKPWGPHYFRIGLDLSTDFAGRSAFNVKISHNRHWLDANGSEWRNQLQIGEVPRIATELYHPLNWTTGIGNDWFVAAGAELNRRQLSVYDNDSGTEQGRFRRTGGRIGLDLGQPWGRLGELRIGLTHLVLHTEPDLIGAGYTGPRNAFTVRETGARLGTVIDQLDYANFPQRGYRLEGEAVIGRRSGLVDESFNRVEAQFTSVGTWGSDTFNLYARLLHADQGSSAVIGRYTLGGFHQLSGYKPGQLDGNELLFGRLTWYRRLASAPLFTRGLFAGASLEAGNAWRQRSAVSLSDLRAGTSAFIGADTALGPLYFGLTYAPRGAAGLVLFIGRP